MRGVHFHPTQPMFVSGGDDLKINVWNYKQRRVLYTLLGHADYIRTVQFHHGNKFTSCFLTKFLVFFISLFAALRALCASCAVRCALHALCCALGAVRSEAECAEHPWILSCSDDQTIRIWNWQSQTLLTTMTGHNHYVMCAQFHPGNEDLVVSASLDQTVRLWDISGLRRRNSAGRSEDRTSDLFGSMDTAVKQVLEGHERGVNWVAFHPTAPLFVSCADDRTIKVWRYSEDKAWESESLRGHYSNVSCCLFHPRQELVLSVSEDKTIRAFDLAKHGSSSLKMKLEHSRFWILVAHPKLNLFAAGHDDGLLIFKLERERPAFDTPDMGSIVVLKEKSVRVIDLQSNKDVPLFAPRRAQGAARARTISFSAADRAALIVSESGEYELYVLSARAAAPGGANFAGEEVEPKRGNAVGAVFVGRKRFAVLERSQQIVVRDLKNEESKRFVAPHPIDAIFPAPANQVLIRSNDLDKISLFDLAQRKVVGEAQVAGVKFAIWSNDVSNEDSNLPKYVAFITKDRIVIANRSLEQLAVVRETTPIKSGVWTESGAFIFNTLTHFKFCLPNGDVGIVRTIDSPLYVCSVRGNTIHCLDRDLKIRNILIDPTEFTFKLALLNKQFDVVLKMVREQNLVGQSVISYLEKKGFPEIALHFVRDDRTRFNLALECGNLDVALETAQRLEDKESWERLAAEALRQGNAKTMELAFRRTNNFEKLSFLMTILGDTPKLDKMQRIAEMMNDPVARFHTSLYRGDVACRVKVLLDVGQLPLAYATAATHGLVDEAAAIAEKLNESGIPLPTIDPAAVLLSPPEPVYRPENANWPLLNVSKPWMEGLLDEKSLFALGGGADDESLAAAGDWGGDDDPPTRSNDEGDWDGDLVETGDGQDGWGIDADVIAELDSTPDSTGGSVATMQRKRDANMWVPPQPGPSPAQLWTRSALAVDHIAAGSYESAMLLLNQQAAVVEFAPLRTFFSTIRRSAMVAVPLMPSLPPVMLAIYRNGDVASEDRAKGLPMTPYTLEHLREKLKQAYKSTTDGKFQDALNQFVYIVHASLFVVVHSKAEANEVHQLIAIAREYSTGLRMIAARQEIPADNVKRHCELTAYFTHCTLQVPHLLLALRLAMTQAYKAKNLASAANFAKRLLDLSPKQDLAAQAKTIIRAAEANPTDAVKIDYDERNPFVICNGTFTPIYLGNPSVKDPLTGASYLPRFAGQVCQLSKVSQIGKEASGLLFFQPERK